MMTFGIFLAALVATISPTLFAAPTTAKPPITNLSDSFGHSNDALFRGHVYKPGLAFTPDIIVTPEGENLTVLSDEGEDGPIDQQPINPDRWVVTSTGTIPRNAGFVSRDIGAEIERILREQCDGGWDYIPGPMCRRDVRRIGRISDHHGKDGWLDMRIESDYIPLPAPGKPGAWNTDKRAFLNLFIRRLRSTIEASVRCDKNRWQYNSMPGRQWCYQYVNIADWYRIAVENRADWPHMKVTFTSNRRDSDGLYDCKGTQTDIWGSLTQDDFVDFSKAVGQNTRWAVECADSWNSQVEGWPQGHCSWNVKDPISCVLKKECDHQ